MKKKDGRLIFDPGSDEIGVIYITNVGCVKIVNIKVIVSIIWWFQHLCFFVQCNEQLIKRPFGDVMDPVTVTPVLSVFLFSALFKDDLFTRCAEGDNKLDCQVLGDDEKLVDFR